MPSLILLVLTMVGLVATINEHDLQKHLMANYNRNVIPKNNSKPVVVKIQVFVEALLSVDEANEVISTKLIILSSWRDKYLTWQPKSFGNVSQTMLKLHEIWFPDLVVENSVTESKVLGFESMNLFVKSDGQVFWMPGATTSTFCAIDTRLFPFDKQTCNIDLSSWVSNNDNIRFEILPQTTTEFTYENGQWEITSTSFRLMEFDIYSKVKFGLNLKRRPMYYITSLIIPMVLISVLNCLSFIIPKQSGERVSYSITVFLAFILMLTLITGTLPKTSTHISVLVVYLGTLLLISFMTIMVSIISLAIENRINGNGKVFEGNKKRNCRFNFWLCKLAGFFDYAAFFLVVAATVVSSIVTYVILVKKR